jgi:FdhD protein
VSEDGIRRGPDQVVTEEPLEIRLTASGRTHRVGITMRTPGGDFELAAGLLFAERVIRRREDVLAIRYCTDPGVEQRFNVVTVDLAPWVQPEVGHLRTHLATAACGVCGKATLEALTMQGCVSVETSIEVSREVLCRLPEALGRAQSTFARTGGLHAAGLFTSRGDRLVVAEDVGRHNAVDKVVGWAFLEDRDLSDAVLMVSGRAGYEIVQKAVVARIPMVCAVSAPSSLAIDVADEFGITLVGFLRGTRFNVYTHPVRVEGLGQGVRSR